LSVCLKYLFLERKFNKLVIISNYPSQIKEQKLVKVLNASQQAIGLHIYDHKGISLTYCINKIIYKDYKPIVQ